MKPGRKRNPLTAQFYAEAAEYGLPARAVRLLRIGLLARMTEDARRVIFSTARWEREYSGGRTKTRRAKYEKRECARVSRKEITVDRIERMLQLAQHRGRRAA